jgi:hypothetical protein
MNKRGKRSNQVRQQSEAAQGVHGRLRRFCLLLSMHIWHERNMYECEVFMSNTELELPHCLYERRGLDIANRSAKLAV